MSLMYLFYDTETTGLPKNFRAPVSDSNNWPRLVQLAWAWFDEAGNEWDSHNHIIYPRDFIIPKEATSVHNISQEQAVAEGEDLERILKKFSEHLSRAKAVLGHNVEFDDNIVGAEFYRLEMPNALLDKKKICTMKNSVNVCKISNNRGGYKWPNLTELHQHLFKTDFDNAHDALEDVMATARCFFALKKQGVEFDS